LIKRKWLGALVLSIAMLVALLPVLPASAESPEPAGSGYVTDGGNLIQDPGFEQQASASIAAPWSAEYGGSGGAGISLNSANPGDRHSGLNNSWLWTGHETAVLKQAVSLNAGKSYELGAWVSGGWTAVNGTIGVRQADGTVIREEPFTAEKSYTFVSLAFDAPVSGGAEVYLRFTAQPAAPLIDDVSLYAIRNFLADPGFESQQTADIAPPWTVVKGGSGSTGVSLSAKPNEKHSGANAVWLWSGWETVELSQKTAILPNHHYRLSVWVSGGWTSVSGVLGVRTPDGRLLHEEPFTAGTTFTNSAIEFDAFAAEEAVVYVKFTNQPAAPLIDDFSLVAMRNHIADPGFEQQPAELVSAPWQFEGDGTHGVIRQGKPGEVHSGANSVWLWTAGGTAGLAQPVNGLEPGKRYKLTAWVSGGWTSIAGKIGLRTPDGAILHEEPFTAGSSYSQVSTEFTASGSGGVAYIRFANQPAAPLIDDWSLTLSTGMSITLDNLDYTLETGQTHQTIVYRTDTGAVIPASMVTFSSTNPAVASVDANGLVTAKGGGTASIKAVYNGISKSARVTVTAVPVPQAPWRFGDVGTPPQPGKARAENGVYTLYGSGRIGQSGDAFHFVSQPLADDGEIAVKLDAVDAGGTGGIMLRADSTSPDAAFAFVGAVNGGLQFVQRAAKGGQALSTPLEGTHTGISLKLVRSGNSIQAFVSADGTSWNGAGEASLAGSGVLQVGLAAAGDLAGTGLFKTVFSGVSVRSKAAAAVDWNTIVSETTEMSYGLNLFKAFDPSTANDPRYIANMDYLNPGFVRYHGWEMMNDHSDPRGWIDTDNHAWDAAKIHTALQGYGGNAIRMINVPGFPSWMDKDGDGYLDAGRADDYAAWLAELVRIVNVEYGHNVTYWEITNERDDNYYVHYRNNGQPDRLDELIEIYNKAAVAMKNVDPSIKTGGLAFARGDLYEQVTRFVEGTLNQTVDPSKTTLDFLSYHFYASGDQRDAGKTIFDRVNNPENPTAGSAAKHTRDIRGIVDSLSPDRHIPIWLDEYNISWTWTNNDPRMRNHMGAIFDTLVMIYAHRNGADAAAAWNEKDGVYGKMDDNYNLQTTAHAYHLLNGYAVGKVVSSVSEDESRLVTFAVKDKRGKLTYLVINRSEGDIDVATAFSGLPVVPEQWEKHTITSAGYAKMAAGTEAVVAMTAPANSMTLFTAAEPADTEAPSAPADLKANGVADTSATIGWSASTDNVGVAGYEVSLNGAVAATLGADARSYDAAGLKPGNAYTFGVAAVDAAGNRSEMSTITVTTTVGAGAVLDAIEAYAASGDIDASLAKKLAKEVEDAAKALEKDKRDQTVAKRIDEIVKRINQTNGQKTISEAARQELQRLAEAWIAQLNRSH